MNLYELSPTFHWTPSSNKVRSTATVKNDKHTYELVVHATKTSPDHIVGWLDKVVKADTDIGRMVEISNKDNRQSLAGFDDISDKLIEELVKKTKDLKLEYLYMFSTTQKRKDTYESLTKKLGKKLGWSVYQDRNYFLVYNTTLDVKQPD